MQSAQAIAEPRCDFDRPMANGFGVTEGHIKHQTGVSGGIGRLAARSDRRRMSMAYQFLPMYNVDAPVGAGERNDRSDVLLVQTLFNVYAHASSFRQVVGGLFAHASQLLMDGVYHPRLEHWIVAFQSTQRSMPQDGKILPIAVSEGHFALAAGSPRSTLLLLNFNALKSAPRAYLDIAQRLQLTINPHI
jgi:hypothetical protein